ncbi:MAG TPA: serpin family protein [Anaerohalosphaeraceae bacterium]|nr:serpin family protein [Anaerohalosphaeraceae bacterium]HOL89326.1 serpin family protein [Anaerohalosphaeraceae bacterium]HPP56765.1 serpin family protein [Anaerohalosphaeraceae bacterium]
MEIRRFWVRSGILSLLAGFSIGWAAQPVSDAGNDPIQQAVKAQTTFAVELYRALAGLPMPQKPVENVFYSPHSISSAMAVVFAGARGNTERQFCDVLHFWLPQESFHEAMGRLENQLTKQAAKGDYELTIANALWMDRRTAFAEPFLKQVQNCYSANLERVDFAANPSGAARVINQWVEKRTRERIKNLIPEGTLDTLTRLVVTNAVYFKGKWVLPFDPQVTRPDWFTVSTYTIREEGPQVETRRVQVPMMTRKDDFGYAENDICQILELPYTGGDLRMVILLPKDPDLIRLEQALTADTLAEWLSRLDRREVEVYLPRFTLTWQEELKGVFALLGLGTAFSADADFSGITGGKDLFLTNVLHKAFVKVDEEGTEAAAATGAVMKLVSIQAPPPVFRADKPFVFLIQDKSTGTVLFVGRVADPTKEK